MIQSHSAPLPWLEQPWQQWLSQFQQQRLAHALLIQGSQGCGKTQLAAQMVQTLLCQHGSGCGHCKSCQLLASDNHPDKIELLPEGNQHKVDSVRALIGQLESTAHQGGARVVVIHQAERLNVAAANALLKTLEEPMPNVYLLLLSNQAGQLLATITSRCQRLLISEPNAAQYRHFLGDAAMETLQEWPYWSALLGGPLAIKQALAENQIPQLQLWRQWWRTSIKSGIVTADLAAIEAELAPLALKVLYFELLFIGRSQPQWFAKHYCAVQSVSQKISWMQRQSGINLTAVYQQLIVQIRQRVS
ncbi:MAG: DNA polymerase III subunit delta' [Ferrimonas sp.]